MNTLSSFPRRKFAAQCSRVYRGCLFYHEMGEARRLERSGGRFVAEHKELFRESRSPATCSERHGEKKKGSEYCASVHRAGDVQYRESSAHSKMGFWQEGGKFGARAHAHTSSEVGERHRR